jgi:hypothetical protein
MVAWSTKKVLMRIFIYFFVEPWSGGKLKVRPSPSESD